MLIEIGKTYLVNFHIVTRFSERDEWLTIYVSGVAIQDFLQSFYQIHPDRVTLKEI